MSYADCAELISGSDGAFILSEFLVSMFIINYSYERKFPPVPAAGLACDFSFIGVFRDRDFSLGFSRRPLGSRGSKLLRCSRSVIALICAASSASERSRSSFCRCSSRSSRSISRCFSCKIRFFSSRSFFLFYSSRIYARFAASSASSCCRLRSKARSISSSSSSLSAPSQFASGDG